MKSAKSAARQKMLSRMFRARAIAYLGAQGVTFPQTPSSAALFDALRKAGVNVRSTPSRKAENLERHIAALDSMMDFTGKLARKSIPADTFYQSIEWRILRYGALRENDGRCELCGASKKDGTRLHVDHIKPRSTHPDLALERTNLQVLCEDCNLGKGNRCTIDWRE